MIKDAPSVTPPLFTPNTKHIGDHGEDWGMPNFNPKDPNQMAKLAAKVTLTVELTWTALQRGIQGFAQFEQVYKGVTQRLYIMTEMVGTTVRWRIMVIESPNFVQTAYRHAMLKPEHFVNWLQARTLIDPTTGVQYTRTALEAYLRSTGVIP